jgi:hypothetical protein
MKKLDLIKKNLTNPRGMEQNTFEVKGNSEISIEFQKVTTLKHSPCRIGGTVVTVLATGPKVCGFKPGLGNGFLKVIKVRKIPSFGGK